MQAQILIVEDEENLADVLALNLELEHHKVLIARSGNAALKLFTNGNKAR